MYLCNSCSYHELHGGQGVKLESRQGDFAEWHRRMAGEPPFLEGEVVGFDSQGRLSRRTAGARMLGIISRSAVVEGSAPPPGDRASYDTVAYAGLVPVRTVKGQGGGRKGAAAACEASPCVSMLVRAAFPYFARCILAEIYLCFACSCQEILRSGNAAVGGSRRGHPHPVGTKRWPRSRRASCQWGVEAVVHDFQGGHNTGK
eukprot:COSAG01_NODE_1456_length_10254_cov_12.591630_5_plen_202_part_00